MPSLSSCHQKDIGVLIRATLDPFSVSVWPVPPCTSSYSGVHRLAFWKGHVKVICCLFPVVWPYITWDALHFPSVSHLLLQYLELFAVASYRGTEWSRKLSQSPIISDAWHFQREELVSLWSAWSQARLPFTPLSSAFLWQWLHSFFRHN